MYQQLKKLILRSRDLILFLVVDKVQDPKEKALAEDKFVVLSEGSNNTRVSPLTCAREHVFFRL